MSPARKIADTELIYDGGDRVARHNGVSVDLLEIPRFLASDHIVAVRYVVATSEYKVRLSSKGWEDMTPVQRALAQDLCERMARAARAQLW